nr:MAG TPA: tail connector protein [Caudoviricetes sp.]
MDQIKELIRIATHFNVTQEYDNVLQYIYDAERQYLLNILNQEDLPSELSGLLDKRVAARFIDHHKDLILKEADLQPITRLKEGDTEIEFGGDNTLSYLSSLISKWTSLEGTDITCYRQLKW